MQKPFFSPDMKPTKSFYQFRLSTFLLLAIIAALVAIVISNRSTIHRLQQKIEEYEEHLPEYNLTVELERLTVELEESKYLYGDAHPIVRKLESEIVALKRRLESAAIFAQMPKTPANRLTPAAPPGKKNPAPQFSQ